MTLVLIFLSRYLFFFLRIVRVRNKKKNHDLPEMCFSFFEGQISQILRSMLEF